MKKIFIIEKYKKKNLYEQKLYEEKLYKRKKKRKKETGSRNIFWVHTYIYFFFLIQRRWKIEKNVYL